MKHIMRLHDSPYQRIKSRKKIVEGRLNDEKRQLLKVGDQIEFISRETGQKLTIEITKLEKFKTFKEMYNQTNLNDWGWKGTKEEFETEFYNFYSKKDEKKYGSLLIYFKLI